MTLAATQTIDDDYVLCLYVAGTSARSMRAIEMTRKICDRYLVGRHSLEVIDLYQHPEAAAPAQIIACQPC